MTTIYAIEASNVREIIFPSDGTDQWGRLSDVLIMPGEALRENSDGGLVRLVCFAYNNLEHVSPLLSVYYLRFAYLILLAYRSIQVMEKFRLTRLSFLLPVINSR